MLWLLKWTEKQDQRICIKFCFQLGKTNSGTIQMMQKVLGNECMSKTRIKEWYNRFKRGRTSVDIDSRSDRPSTTKTLDNIERVRLAIEGDRRLTVRGTRKWSRNTENYCLRNFEQDFRNDSRLCGDWLLHHDKAPAHSSYSWILSRMNCAGLAAKNESS